MRLIHNTQNDEFSDLQSNNRVFINDHSTHDLLKICNDLRKVEDKFYKIFELNPCPMAINSLNDNSIVDVNKAFMKVIGVKEKNEVIGKITTEDGLKILKESDKIFVVDKIKKDGIITDYLTTVVPLKGRKFKGLFSGALIEMNNIPCILTICQIVNNKSFFNFFKQRIFSFI